MAFWVAGFSYCSLATRSNFVLVQQQSYQLQIFAITVVAAWLNANGDSLCLSVLLQQKTWACFTSPAVLLLWMDVSIAHIRVWNCCHTSSIKAALEKIRQSIHKELGGSLCVCSLRLPAGHPNGQLLWLRSRLKLMDSGRWCARNVLICSRTTPEQRTGSYETQILWGPRGIPVPVHRCLMDGPVYAHVLTCAGTYPILSYCMMFQLIHLSYAIVQTVFVALVPYLYHCTCTFNCVLACLGPAFFFLFLQLSARNSDPFGLWLSYISHHAIIFVSFFYLIFLSSISSFLFLFLSFFIFFCDVGTGGGSGKERGLFEAMHSASQPVWYTKLFQWKGREVANDFKVHVEGSNWDRYKLDIIQYFFVHSTNESSATAQRILEAFEFE